jgi:hypothetical protein
MNTDVEDLLRQGMERFTADLRAPAELTRRVAQRRRRLARRPVVAASAALAAAAVALVAVVVPRAGHLGIARRITPAAYVVKRVDSALSAAEPGAIAQMTVRTRFATHGGGTVTTTAQEWSRGGRWRSVMYSSAGHPLYDEGSTASSVYTLVSHLTREWARQHLLPGNVVTGPGTGPHLHVFRPKPVPHGCAVLVPLLFQAGLPGVGATASSMPGTVARDLRTAISCGTLTMAGRQRVDGIEAIKLTSGPKSPVSETVWATPGTYLPVRVLIRSALGGPPAPLQKAGMEVLQRTADITWLPPTPQNLAKLTVPIPAGFRRVPLVRILWPIMQAPGPGHLRPLIP